MKKLLALFLLLIPNLCLAAFSDWFSDKTMRIDYFHTGKKGSEIFSLDQVYEQGIWAGSKINLVDTLNLGKYQVKIYDHQTSQLIYSRGFSSIYGEWETTEEAVSKYRTFHETVLIPAPKKPVWLTIAKRAADGRFQEIWKDNIINPNSRFINREIMHPNPKVKEIFINGPCSTKVDLLILGDGYAEKAMKKYQKDVQYLIEKLFANPPFERRRNDFNVRALQVPSLDSGIDEPRRNVWRNTAFGSSFNSLDLARYVLSTANKDIRDLTAAIPYDQIMMLFNSDRYGGGGIFNLYAISFSGSEKSEERWQAEYVFVHEFGHAFAGLADEYYSSAVAYDEFYPANVEPWEPNITALLDKSNLKWKDLMDNDTPIPTPWRKSTYDSLAAEKAQLSTFTAAGQQKSQAIEKQMLDLLLTEKYWGKVGVFEGAGYQSEGIYRPFLDCRMFSKRLVPFDPVCQAAIERIIDFYSR